MTQRIVVHQENDLENSTESLVYLEKILDKWSATKFSEPFLSLISRSNSYSNRVQLMSLGLVSFLANKYLKAAWSVNTITFEHRR